MRFVNTSNVRTRFDEQVPMRDGTVLSVDVYLPPEPGRYPVLLERTPYDNNRTPDAQGGGGSIYKHRGDFPPRVPPAELYKLLAAHGYVVAAADVRGRGDSEGRFTAFVHEGTDGFDTIEWLCRYPESNGKIGTFGAGYAAFCQWAAAVERPSGLVTMISSGAFGAPFDGLPSRGGAWRLDWLFWMHLVGGRTLQPPNLPVWHSAWTTLPISVLDEAIGHAGLPWKEWLSHPSRDEYWDSLDLTDKVRELELPVLHWTGWWDSQITPAMSYWDAMQRSPAASRQRLVIGPWDHAGLSRPQPGLGGFYFGPRAVVEVAEVMLQWFDRHLKEGQPGTEPVVRIFTTGRNAWSDLTTWPPRATESQWWLSSAGRANTMRGDGRLVPGRPLSQEESDHYTYDPHNPVLIQPAFKSFSRDDPALVTLDQSFLEWRDDCLCYTSEPLESAVLVMGRPILVLWAGTDAASTDWVAAISDLLPNGRSLHLTHSVLRVDSPRDGSPQALRQHVLVFDDVGHEFQAGDRIRVVITSSLFPLYSRNLGTKEAFTHATTVRRAEQVIGHGSDHPSHLVLPVVL